MLLLPFGDIISDPIVATHTRLATNLSRCIYRGKLVKYG